MPALSNERLCKLAQAGDTAARDILLENNLGFIRKSRWSNTGAWVWMKMILEWI